MMVDRTLERELNKLIRLMHDSVKGYAKAAELVQSEEYRALFTQLGTRREEFVEELSVLENVVGGDPVEDGAVQAVLYRATKELEVLVAGDGDIIILKAVREVLDHTIKRYESILANHLTISADTVKNLIERQHQELLTTQTQIEELISKHKSE